MEKTKEQRYEELVNAIEGGTLTLAKFWWNLLSEIDGLIEQTPQAMVQKRVKEVDALLKQMKANPPKDGKTPTKEELLALITPLIPPAIPGKPGKTPTEDELLELIESIMPEPIPGPPGPSMPGKPGKNGRIPAHEWRGTFIRFENPDGTWGEWVNIQGAPSEPIEYGGKPGFAGSVPSITLVQGVNRFEGVTKIVLDESLNATRTPNGVVISAPAGGGMSELIPIESPDGIITTFTFSQKPKFIVTEISNFVEGDGFGFTWSGSEATLPLPPSVFIRGYV